MAREVSKPGMDRENCIVAVKKSNGKFFGGKAAGTHIGYPQINYLKAAMTHAKVKHSDYRFVQLSFNEDGVPTLTLLEDSHE